MQLFEGTDGLANSAPLMPGTSSSYTLAGATGWFVQCVQLCYQSKLVVFHSKHGVRHISAAITVLAASTQPSRGQKFFPNISCTKDLCQVLTFQPIITCWNHNEIYLYELVSKLLDLPQVCAAAS